MTIQLELQCATSATGIPTNDLLQSWAEAALQPDCQATELVIRVVDEAESAELNQTYRARSGPTNILSFPFQPPPLVPNTLLGDLVICAPLVKKEAAEQEKTEQAHWAHLVVHGVLHLQGYDHQTPTEADKMEAQERRILAQFGFADPYAIEQQS